MSMACVIDWSKLRASLDTSKDRLADPLSTEQKNRILAERKRQLNTRAEVASTTGTRMLVMRIGDESWCLPLSRAGNVFPIEQTTPIPGAPIEIAGIHMRRGRIVTLIDLPALLGIGTKAQDRTYQIAVKLRETSPLCALLADGIDGISEIDLERLETPPSQSDHKSIILGMAPDARTILDTDSLIKILMLQSLPAQQERAMREDAAK